MGAYKDPQGGWFASVRYEDWTGARKRKVKRGFKMKREAQAWERDFIEHKAAEMSMLFKNFVNVYFKDVESRLKLNTVENKKQLINKKIIPYFGNKKMNEIMPKDIIHWQNEMISYRSDKGKKYSQVYLKTLHNQVSAIFNHAVRFYNLRSNPASRAGSMGRKNGTEMLFWTKDEYLKFADAMMDKPISFYAFEMLYWCELDILHYTKY